MADRDLAIRNTHATVVTINGGGTDSEQALDANGDVVSLDADAIATEETRLDGIYNGLAYSRTRAAAYDEVKEQLDQLYHDMAADKGDKTGTWFAAIKAVKDATPKP